MQRKVVEPVKGRHPGERVRREVLGDEYVDRARGTADSFTTELQGFLTEHCWGLVWTRPGLDRKSRSIATLSSLAATGHWSEFGTHIHGALRNGCTVDEIRELLLHLGVYLGVPTAVEAFRTAQPIVCQFVDGQSNGGTTSHE